MTLLPLRQGCALLGIDAKTLRHWMQQANLSLHPHPNDARIKCVTSEHLEQLAALHRRPVDVPAALARLHSAQACPPLLPENASSPNGTGPALQACSPGNTGGSSAATPGWTCAGTPPGADPAL